LVQAFEAKGLLSLIVKCLRDAVDFGDYQHVRPIAVLAVWATALFAAWLVVARRRQAATM
jgi:hypothetical protein